jgi:multiple sugar transport system ATP-binding protein
VAEVTLKNVVRAYGDVVAVNDVSLNVADGEFVALVGPSGCGKTTTLNLVAGLQPMTSGEIHIGGRLVNGLDPKDRDIAMVFQNYALYPNKTVYKNLAFPLEMRRLARSEIDRKVQAAAKTLDIVHLLERRPRELSGGQQQRVALGRALVRDPQVFLMDEPLSNLDAKLRAQMRSELKRFHQDLRATVIYVTHDQLEALTMADKMAVMHGGTLQQYDSPTAIFARPANVFVAGFVGSPEMSMIPLAVETPAGRAVLAGPDGFQLQLSEANARRAAKAQDGKVILGARHSSVALLPQGDADAVAGRVYTIEPTGDVTFAYVRVGGSVVVVSVDPQTKLAPDQQVWLAFDQDKIHLFDAKTQRTLADEA